VKATVKELRWARDLVTAKQLGLASVLESATDWESRLVQVRVSVKVWGLASKRYVCSVDHSA
jgi:hypothetical protein